MGWLILIVIVVVVIAALNSSSSKNEAEGIQKINAVAEVLSSESVFRESWQYSSRNLTNENIDSDKMDQVVSKFFGRHVEIWNMAKTLTKANHKMLMPVLIKRAEALDSEIADFVGSPLSEAWRNTSRTELDKI